MPRYWCPLQRQRVRSGKDLLTFQSSAESLRACLCSYCKIGFRRKPCSATQLRELEGQLSEARRSGQALDAARADLDAQLAAAREERDAAAAREASAVAAATNAEARLADQAADAKRQASLRLSLSDKAMHCSVQRGEIRHRSCSSALSENVWPWVLQTVVPVSDARAWDYHSHSSCAIAPSSLPLCSGWRPSPKPDLRDAQSEERIIAAEAAQEARVAELEAQLASATQYADGQGQHIGQLEAQLGDAQRRQQSLQEVCFRRCDCLPVSCCAWPAHARTVTAHMHALPAREDALWFMCRLTCSVLPRGMTSSVSCAESV